MHSTSFSSKNQFLNSLISSYKKMAETKALGCKVLWFLTLTPVPEARCHGQALGSRDQLSALLSSGLSRRASLGQDAQLMPPSALSPPRRPVWVQDPNVPHKPWRLLSKLVACTTELSTPGVLCPPRTRWCSHQNEHCVTLARCHTP